jgi:hypothetical protein
MQGQAPRRRETRRALEGEATQKQGFGDEAFEILRRLRLHAGGNLFGKKFKKKVWHGLFSARGAKSAAGGAGKAGKNAIYKRGAPGKERPCAGIRTIPDPKARLRRGFVLDLSRRSIRSIFETESEQARFAGVRRQNGGCAMKIFKSSAWAGAALLAVTTTVSAGPMRVASAALITPPQPQVEQIRYKRRVHHHRHRHYARHRHYYRYGANPGAAFAGAALGLFSLPFAAAAGAWCGPYNWSCSYGWPYYGGSYYGYYPSYGYYGRPYYGSYGWPRYRHYGHRYAGYGGWRGGGWRHGGGWRGGGWHGGGVHTMRSVGFRGGGWHGGHGGGWHGGGRR